MRLLSSRARCQLSTLEFAVSVSIQQLISFSITPPSECKTVKPLITTSAMPLMRLPPPQCLSVGPALREGGGPERSSSISHLVSPPAPVDDQWTQDSEPIGMCVFHFVVRDTFSVLCQGVGDARKASKGKFWAKRSHPLPSCLPPPKHTAWLQLEDESGDEEGGSDGKMDT